MQRVLSTLPLAERTDGSIWVPATPDQARELMWIRSRFPMEVTHEAEMRKAAAEFHRRQARAEAILRTDYKPREIQFANNRELRDYQGVGADLWQAVNQLLLADKVGLGKTVTTIAALIQEHMRPACIVLPPALENQWVRKLEEFAPALTCHVVSSSTPYELDVFGQCPNCDQWHDTTKIKRCPRCRFRLDADINFPDVTLCSYSKVHGWVEHLADICQSVVFEEAHALRRDSSQKWAACHELAMQVEYRLGLTATPLVNMGGEIFNILECIAPGYLGPKEQFRAYHCVGSGQNGREPALSDPDAFGSYLRDSNLMLRRSPEDVGMKPGQVNHIVYEVEASGEVFRDATDRAGELARILMSGDKLGRGEVMRASGQFENIVRQATGLAKAPFVAAFVELLAEQEIPVVVWAHHHAVHDILCDRLKKYNPVRYTGNESKPQKDAAVERFVRGDASVFVGALRSGEGLDGLQHRASTMVFAELDWSWSLMAEQCVGRLNRDGQTENVTAYYMLSEYGLDPTMAEVLEIKKSQLQGLVGESELGPVRKVDPTLAIISLAQSYLKKVAS